MKQLSILFLIFTCLVGMNSCQLPEFGAADTNEWNPDFAIPVINTSIALQDLLDNFETGGFVTTDSNKMIVVVYEDQFQYSFASDFEKIKLLPLPITGNTQNAPFPLPLRYDEIHIDSAIINFTVSNPSSSEDVNVNLTIPNLTQMGTPLQIAFTIPADESYTEVVSLVDYVLSFPNQTFTSQYTAIGVNSGMNINLQPFVMFLDNINYSFVKGYFGIDTIPMGEGCIVFDFLKNWSQGTIVFRGPKVKFSFNNSYGVPLQIYADSLIFRTHLNGMVDLNNNNISNGFNLNYPTIGQIGQNQFSALNVNGTNSNIIPAMGGVPYEMCYALKGVFNIDEDINILNFLTDSAHIDLGIHVELPMHLSAKDFGVKQSFDIDFREIDAVESVGFKYIVENGFPFDIGMQLRFLDIGGNAIDSLWIDKPEVLIQAAPVNSQGFVTTPQLKETIVAVTADRFKKIKDLATKIELEGTFETFNEGNTPVKILSTYQIEMKLGVIVGL